MSAKVLEENKAQLREFSKEFRDEIEKNFMKNIVVGEKILFENDLARVWDIDLLPGGRLPFHYHGLNYFYTPLVQGEALTHHYHQGEDFVSVKKVSYMPKDPTFISFKKGEYLFHDLKNIGEKRLSFLTIEMKVLGESPMLLLDFPHLKNIVDGKK